MTSQSTLNKTDFANTFEALLFTLGADKEGEKSTRYAINVFKVREILEMQRIIRTPFAPPGVEGMVNIRGEVFPVIHLAKVLGMENAPEPRLMLVAEFANRRAVFLVGEVEEMVSVGTDQLTPASELLGKDTVVNSLMRLPSGDTVAVLDVEGVLGRFIALDDSAESHVARKVEKDARVLYVDDSRLARDIVHQLLVDMGVQPIEAVDGEDALARLEALGHALPSAVVADIEMPGIDGYALTRRIKQDPRFAKVPVIVYSSLSSDECLRRGMACGADQYVAKFDRKALQDALHAVLGAA